VHIEENSEQYVQVGSHRDREHAVSYAEWVARELDRVKIRVYNRDGGLAERRVIDNVGKSRSATLKGPPKPPTVTFEQLTYSNMLSRSFTTASRSTARRSRGTGNAERLG